MRDGLQFFGGIFLTLFFVVGAFLLAIAVAYWINSLWAFLWLAVWMPLAATAIIAFIFAWEDM